MWGGVDGNDNANAEAPPTEGTPLVNAATTEDGAGQPALPPIEEGRRASGEEHGATGSPHLQRSSPLRQHRRTRSGQQRHHRRDSSLADLVLEVINEGVLFAEETVETVVENVSEVVENVAEVAHTAAEEFRENVVEESKELAEAVVDEMHNADDGDNFFLEMSLSRNLSILPADMQHIAESRDVATAIQATAESEQASEAGDGEPSLKGEGEATELTPLHKAEEAVVPVAPVAAIATSAAGTLSAYILLASAVVSLSSIGPLLDMQRNCSPTIKIYWRMSLTAYILFPFAAYQLHKEGRPKFTVPQISTLCLSAACYATMCTAFVLSLDYTAVGNAVILSNSQAIMLLVAKFLVGDSVSIMEGSGAITAFLGAILCSKDSANQERDEVAIVATTTSDTDSSTAHGPNTHLTLLGDFFGLLAGIGGCGYLIFAKQVRSHVGLYIFMFLNMFLGSTLVLIFMTLALGEHVSFDRHETHGVWGWINPAFDRLPLELLMVIIW